MTTFETIELYIREPFAYIILNRPQVRNAMNQQMVDELLTAFTWLRDNRDVRGIVISGAGDTFCAGGDIKEMQAAYADPNFEDNSRTQQFDVLMNAVNTAPQVVIARVDGAAIGGGLGLVCASDIAIASIDTIFALSEVRLGIIPSLIMPYIVQRIGLTNTRRLVLTGARFDGEDAFRLGLIHELTGSLELDDRVNIALADVRECSPLAIAACKKLLFEVADPHFDTDAVYRSNILDELRRSEDGQEGMLAFIQKRKPNWAHVERE